LSVPVKTIRQLVLEESSCFICRSRLF